MGLGSLDLEKNLFFPFSPDFELYTVQGHDKVNSYYQDAQKGGCPSGLSHVTNLNLSQLGLSRKPNLNLSQCSNSVQLAYLARENRICSPQKVIPDLLANHAIPTLPLLIPIKIGIFIGIAQNLSGRALCCLLGTGLHQPMDCSSLKKEHQTHYQVVLFLSFDSKTYITSTCF